MSSTLRITGLASGLDVESTVKQMMQAQMMRVDKVKQQRQLIQWRQDIYRDVIGDLNTFKSAYFDVLKPDSYMLSNKNYSSFDVTNPDTLTATPSAGAAAGNYKITVNQLAEKARIEGADSEINVAQAFSDFSFPAVITKDVNDSISVDVDGTTYSIKLDEGNYSLGELAGKINSKLSTADGGDASQKFKAVLSSDNTYIKFEAIKTFDANKTLTIDDGGTSYNITIEKGNYSASELAAKINEKLKSASGSNSTTADLFTTNKLKAAVSADGSNIEFSGSAAVTTNPIASTSMTLQSITLQNTVNADVMANNSLKYERKIITGLNDTLKFKVNGTDYSIILSPTTVNYGRIGETGSSTDIQIRTDLAKKIHDEIIKQTALVNAKIDARLSLDQTRIELVSRSNNTVNVSGNAASTLGFSSSFDINQSTDNKMSLLLGDNFKADGTLEDAVPQGRVEFTINDGIKDVTFRYDFNSTDDVTEGTAPNEVKITGAKNKSISDIINDISSKANVKLSYSQLTRKFVLESNATGQAQTIMVGTNTAGSSSVISTTDKFLNILFGSARSDSGLDAKVNIVDPNAPIGSTGVDVVKSSNSFTIDGVNYNLLKADPGVQKTMTLAPNSQKTFDKIKAFVDKYNEIIDKINKKLEEKKDINYQPLTDDQKKDMKDEDIKKWDDKAKEGLISRDSTLENMLSAMRRAFFDGVKSSSTDPDGTNIGITLQQIGLSTSSDISQRGKIIIDEAKLKDAIQNKGDKVAQLFTKTSSSVSYYSPDNDNTKRTQRYYESGIFQRINDILQDNLRTMRDSNGEKGILLEKAGIQGDYTEFHNLLTDELKDKDKMISDLTRKAADKENQYYLQFSKLETAMQKMNDQSSWFAQQIGSMNGGK